MTTTTFSLFPEVHLVNSNKMTRQCVIFVLLSVFQTSGQISFTSQYEGTTVKGSLGSFLQFNWSFSGDVDSVDWGLTLAADANVFDSNQRLYSLPKTGSILVTPPQRYTGRVSGSRGGGKAIFTLSKLEVGDARFYGCRLTPTAPDGDIIWDNVKLVVEGPPKITHISANQTVNVGDDVKLNCTADGNPSPSISWKKLTDDSVVTMPLTGIRRQDEGGYRCTANNGIGNPASGDVFITVQYKPKGVTIFTNATRNTAKQGQNVALTCDVSEAKPPVSDYRFYLNDSILTPVTNVNKFIIQDVKRSQHFGKYKCVAHNDAGDGQSDQVVLNITVPAEIQWVTGNLTVNETNPIDLTCDTTGYPSPDVTWRKVGGETYQGSVLHIENSTKMNSGIYVCEADNGEGRAEMKTFVTVQYQATITSAKASETKSWVGQTVRLECAADGVPLPTLTWKTPDGSEIKKDRTKQNIENVSMENDQDFGNYTCEAENGVGVIATSTVQVNQIKAPGSPNITVEIEATSLTVRWTAPDDDGGSPITGYQVVILQSGKVIENKTLGAGVRVYSFDSLNRSTNYTLRVSARNKVFEGDASELKVKTKYEGPPAAVEMLDLPAVTEETEVTLMWNKPQNNGAPITKYTVYQLNGADGLPRDWIKIKEKTNLSDLKFVVQKLEKDKVYEFAVTATNKHGESLKADKSIKQIKVLGDAPEPVVITVALNEDGKITLKWKKPEDNGAAVILYSKYQRITGEEQWTNRENITDTSKRSHVFNVKKGEMYEFVMTATNSYGESEKTNVQEVEVLADKGPPSKTSGGMGTAVVAGAAAAGVLLIVGLIILVVWWKRRKASADDGSSSAGLRNVNPDELDDGYHAVGAPSAARQLQACGRVPDATYAEVDMSQKTNRPVADVYAQVDKSKKPKKKQKKNPGELDYAELDDLRPNVRPAPPPSGANARPLVRAPAYEGTEYADITQFGAPQAEPTYGNVPKKDVVYSNVESM